VRLGTRVTGVSRAGRDRIVDADRELQPFVVHFTHADGREDRVPARAVIDASGTWGTPGPAGASGLPALGERAAADRIVYRVPDLGSSAVRARYAGRRTAVIGSGASAFTALAELARLAKSADGAGTESVWVLRRAISGSTFGGGGADQLPERGALGLAAKAAVDDGHAEAVTGFRTEAIERTPDSRVVLVGEDGRRLDPVDEVIVLTGFRPDLNFLDELRLGLDERLQAPTELAPLIDPTRPTAQVRADTVPVPAHRTLPIESALARDLAAVLLAADACGTAARCLRTAVEHARVREQFGRPIGAFQAVKHLCADMLVRLEQARALTWDAARAADEE
ncbi:acyl-CoA dehydrogenase family protein, partial [Streptomyces rubiginosohelvolus]|uniref:acyl-CoA dehydrogenase family protein n=1 Tax=Streptomyces rubiginosohelvolus TaxID=67362 RepID=UPI0033DD4411